MFAASGTLFLAGHVVQEDNCNSDNLVCISDGKSTHLGMKIYGQGGGRRRESPETLSYPSDDWWTERSGIKQGTDSSHNSSVAVI